MSLTKKIFQVLFLLSFSLFVFLLFKIKFQILSAISGYYFLELITLFLLMFISVFVVIIPEKYNELKEYTLILLISIFFSFYLFEVYLGYTKNQPEGRINYTKKILSNLFNDQFDKKSKFRKYKDLKTDNKEASIYIQPNLFLINKNKKIHTLSGVSNAITLYCNENGFYTVYKSDRYGFNNNDSIWDKKKIDYLLIGDSFVHGACVKNDENLASNLARSSNKNVLNLGQGGSGPLDQLATLIEYSKLEVKKVVWFFYEGNDLESLNKNKSTDFLQSYLNIDDFNQNLIKQNDFADELKKSVIDKVHKVNSKLSFLKLYQTRLFFKEAIKNKKKKEDLNYDLFKKVITKAKKFSQNKNSKFYFVYLPEFSRFSNNEIDEKKYFKVKKIIKDLNINFIDVKTNIFLKKTDPLSLFPFRMNGHYTSEAYNEIANYIYLNSKEK
mgnify:CR=1 FL=1